MRTTLTLESDVQQLLQQAMRDGESSFKDVVNDAIRKGLRPQPARWPERFAQLTFDTGRQLVDLTKANTLSGELEDQDLIAKSADER